MRKIETLTWGERTAVVYRDTQWGEFRTKHYVRDVYQVGADAHNDDKDDALASAQSWAGGLPAAKRQLKLLSARLGDVRGQVLAGADVGTLLRELEDQVEAVQALIAELEASAAVVEA